MIFYIKESVSLSVIQCVFIFLSTLLIVPVVFSIRQDKVGQQNRAISGANSVPALQHTLINPNLF